MPVSARVALLCVTVLCALVECAQCQRGYCNKEGCMVVYREPVAIQRAKMRCRALGGPVFLISKGFEYLPYGVKTDVRHDWLPLRNRSSGYDAETCLAISRLPSGILSASTEGCKEGLEGYLCYLKMNNPCGLLQVNKEIPVQYKSYMGFVFENSETFPPDTLAVTGKAEPNSPESKHLCHANKWLRAPWDCEFQQGGCEHSCERKNRTFACGCAAGRSLHPNSFACVDDPCRGCAHHCRQEGDSRVCACNRGYRLGPDRKSCFDVDECAEKGDLCTGEEEECMNTNGGYACVCRDGFDKEDGVCVNVTNCVQCEHMRCKETNGVFACECRRGYMVSGRDPTKCVLDCGESCRAECVYNPDLKQKDTEDCFCPEGYIKDFRSNVTYCVDIDDCAMGMCSQRCENKHGGYRCFCDEGFELKGKDRCEPVAKTEVKGEGEGKKGEGEGEGEGDFKKDAYQLTRLPQYIKTGSILGISVFLLLCSLCVCYMVWRLFRRCSSFSLPSLSGPDKNVFYLQQVTTETYKRLSFDRQSTIDGQ